jgi:hypothetical protein
VLLHGKSTQYRYCVFLPKLALATEGTDTFVLFIVPISFFDKHMAHRMRPGCGVALSKHKRAKQRCLICTTSWQHPAQAAARLFGLETGEGDVLCSVMEIGAGLSQSPRSASLTAHTRTRRDVFPLTVCPYIAIYKTDTFFSLS